MNANFGEVYGACIYLCVTKGNATKPTDIVSSKHTLFIIQIARNNARMCDDGGGGSGPCAMRKNFRNDIIIEMCARIRGIQSRTTAKSIIYTLYSK